MEELEEDYRSREGFEVSKFYESEGRLRWIWRKGVNLGKTMVVMGVAISSAPFVLPPLVTLSAIGFTLSLPAGFVFASFACTDKLMSLLLPIPSPLPSLELGTMYCDDDDEVEKEYEVDNVICAEVKESEDDSRNGLELVEECDEPDRRMGVTEIVDEYMDAEEQKMDTNVIPVIMEGIREVENEISLMERNRVKMPRDSLRALVVEAEVGGENENNVKQVAEELVFVQPREENRNVGDLANIDEGGLRNETVGLLERIKDDGRDDNRRQDGLPTGTCEEKKQNWGIPIDQNLFIIPEEVKPFEIEETEDLYETVGDRSENGNESEIPGEQAELVKTSGNHTCTFVNQGIGSNENTGTRIRSNEDEMGMADEGKFGDGTDARDSSSDSLNKRFKGEDIASDSGIDARINYSGVQIESFSVSEHAEIGLDREITSGFDKELVNEEKIWEQIETMRAIIGYKTASRTSCVEELTALYEFTGVEAPVLSKDANNLANVYEKLYFLKSIIGFK